MPEIHTFHDRAMATYYEVRIAGADRQYATQAARAALDLIHKLEAQLSRFRPASDIAQIARLSPGEKLRMSEATFACLHIAQTMQAATRGAFSPTPYALQAQPAQPEWTLLPGEQSIRCDSGRLEFDLGAIGKGFALDRMADLLREWDCTSWLLVAGGSSILAGSPPPELPGWSCGLGEDNSPRRLSLSHASLSGSGLAVKGSHIFDPRTGLPALRQQRAWAVTDTAAESDALSTAAMVLTPDEFGEVLAQNNSWLGLLEHEDGLIALGPRPLPPGVSQP